MAVDQQDSEYSQLKFAYKTQRSKQTLQRRSGTDFHISKNSAGPIKLKEEEKIECQISPKHYDIINIKVTRSPVPQVIKIDFRNYINERKKSPQQFQSHIQWNASTK